MLRSLFVSCSRRLWHVSRFGRVSVCRSTSSAQQQEPCTMRPFWASWTLGSMMSTITTDRHASVAQTSHNLSKVAIVKTAPGPPHHAVTRSYLMEAVERGRSRAAVEVRSLSEPILSDLPSNLVVEELEYHTEEGLQGWVPLRIIQQPGGGHKPVVIFLHSTGVNKDSMLPWMQEYALAGYLTAAIDCRYHGQRCPTAEDQSPRDAYEDALIDAWREGTEKPFLLDDVWDLVHLLDYLCTRPDVDKTRIGMTGVSLGGMHTWLCAAVDPRVSVAAPIIGVHNFGWALRNNSFQGRVESIPRLFAAAAEDLAKPGADAEVVDAVWRRMLPGLLEHYDATMSLPCVSPRPLLVVNGEVDPRCPVAGLNEALEPTRQAYVAAGASDQLCVYLEPATGHQVTDTMQGLVRYWFDMHLQQNTKPGGWWCSVM